MNGKRKQDVYGLKSKSVSNCCTSGFLGCDARKSLSGKDSGDRGEQFQVIGLSNIDMRLMVLKNC